MRRVLVSLLLALTIAPMAASAAQPWRLVSDKHLGFSVRVPPGWKVEKVDQFQSNQLTMTYAGKVNYALNVTILPFKSGASIQATKNTFVTFEAGSQHNSIFVHLPWSATAIGGRNALVTLVKPSTEGGVNLTSAVYVVTSRGNVYMITTQAYRRLVRLSQFPALYSQILRTWRFL
jgi:hypothetical protein